MFKIKYNKKIKGKDSTKINELKNGSKGKYEFKKELSIQMLKIWSLYEMNVLI